MAGALSKGALAGLKVLDCTHVIAGAYCSMVLADLGADVVKIEPPGSPDPIRTWGQAELDGQHFFWTVHARNKRCVTLNLREPRGRELVAVEAVRDQVHDELLRLLGRQSVSAPAVEHHDDAS